MKHTDRREADTFHEAMPGTMDQPQLWRENSDRRGMLAWLLVPLAIIGGLAIWGAQNRKAERSKYIDNGKDLPE